MICGLDLFEGSSPSVTRSCVGVFGISGIACSAGFRVMVGKSFVMMVVATMLGPVIGVGLFLLLNNF